MNKEDLGQTLTRNMLDLTVEELEYSLEMSKKARKQMTAVFVACLMLTVIGIIWIVITNTSKAEINPWYYNLGYLLFLPHGLSCITFILPFNFYPFCISWNGTTTEMLWRSRGYGSWLYRSMFRLGNFVILYGSLISAPNYDAIKLDKDKHIYNVRNKPDRR